VRWRPPPSPLQSRPRHQALRFPAPADASAGTSMTEEPRPPGRRARLGLFVAFRSFRPNSRGGRKKRKGGEKGEGRKEKGAGAEGDWSFAILPAPFFSAKRRKVYFVTATYPNNLLRPAGRTSAVGKPPLHGRRLAGGGTRPPGKIPARGGQADSLRRSVELQDPVLGGGTRAGRQRELAGGGGHADLADIFAPPGVEPARPPTAFSSLWRGSGGV
jgi:hypothetical protein